MDLIQIILLALVQGLTEFLPISSSAHLILAPHLFGFADQGLPFDLAVHLGTLLAVVLYFRKLIGAVLYDWIAGLAPGRPLTANARLGWQIILATLPVMVVGVLIKDLVEHQLRSPLVIAATTIVFGLVLWWADRGFAHRRPMAEMSWRQALVIGIAQALALVPGTSRSGITMTAALMLGYTREAAARFSFLLAVPTILASVVWVGKDLVLAPEPVDWAALGLGVTFSFLAALATIHLFLRYIERMGMAPFAWYRLALGTLILWLVYA